MHRYLKVLLRIILGDYEVFDIFRFANQATNSGCFDKIVEIESADCRQSPHFEIRALADYAAADARGFGILHNDELVCACWYWYGQHYAHNRGFWPHEDREAKLVQITTAHSARGQGLARSLIAASSIKMRDEGFRQLFARVWFSHGESERAFRAAGWQRIATVITVQPTWWKRGVRLQLPRC